MTGFFNLLAAGAGSLSFSPTMELPDSEYKPYETKIKLEKPRTPAEIMKSAWDDVGMRMRESMAVVEAEYGQQIT
ncbi:MAG: hypothetical protein FWC26_03075 [Fibromonadales bacterium]|nr:hypothetical protein [Fibromonadales bacterium]